MTPLELRGILPIIATPFTPSGKVDEESFRHLLHVLAKGGCHALTLFGIAGEYYKLTDEEQKRLAQITTEECRKAGARSVISVTSHATEVAIETARRWESLGADALMLLPPFFLKPGTDATDYHIRQVGAAVKIPVMVQYAPEQTGVAIPPSLFAAIAQDLPNVRDFKIECKPPGRYISKLLDLVNVPVRIHVGNAGFNMIETFDRGAVGAMPGCSMFDLYLQIYHALMAGNREEALRLHTPLVALLNHIRQDVEMIIRFEKLILKRRGIIAHDYCRVPSMQPDACEMKLFDHLYEAIQPLLTHIP